MPQSLSHLLTHLVFSTKHREPLLATNIRPRLFEYMGGILRDLECQSIAINGIEDHVHLLFILSRKRALMDVVEELKVGTSKWLKHRDESLVNFYWQNGYAAFSVSQSNVPAVKTYIETQEEHHRSLNFKDELRSLLTKHGVVFDERYLWD